MLISIDHGNKQIKTTHRTFTSGLYESENRPAFGEDILYYKQKYYTISDERIPYMRDKTQTDHFFILTLFAIAYEIEAAGAYTDDEIIEIKLAVGLPPSHYSVLYEKFETYLNPHHDVIDFEFRGKPYSIYISDVKSYPQAIAAAMSVYSLIDREPKVLIVDIGGFTADYVMLKNGKPDLSVCDSLEHGVIILYNSIRSKVNADFDMLLDETDIDSILLRDKHTFPHEIVSVVNKLSNNFIEQLLGKLRERKIDLRVGKTIFVGGGSILLRRYLESSQRVSAPIILDDVAANTKGYERLYKASKGR